MNLFPPMRLLLGINNNAMLRQKVVFMLKLGDFVHIGQNIPTHIHKKSGLPWQAAFGGIIQ
jgi:hypothetical protein